MKCLSGCKSRSYCRLELNGFKCIFAAFRGCMKQFWRIARYIRPYRRFIALNMLSNLGMAIFSVISIPALIPFLQVLLGKEQPPVTQRPELSWSIESATDYFYYQMYAFAEVDKEKALLFVCATMVVVYFFRNLFRYFSLVFMLPVSNGIVRDIRAILLDKLLLLPLSFFTEERKGDLMSRFTADVQEIETSILSMIQALIREPLMILGALALMLYISPPLLLFSLTLILFTAVIIGGVGRALKRSSSAVQFKLGDLVSLIEETLSGLRVVKGFNAEGFVARKFGFENNTYKALLIRMNRRRNLASPLSEFLGVTTVCVLIWYGYREVQSGDLTVPRFLAFLYAFFSIIDPVKSFSNAYYNVQKGLAAVDRVEQVMMAETDLPEPVDPVPFTGFHRDIVFEMVSFAYKKSDVSALQNINITIPKGKVLALVGLSGSGKSTLVDMIPRFHDPTEGRILIDGVDLRRIRTRDLRTVMGIVSQEPILFNDSIYHNIVFGLEGVKESEVIEAAKAAHAHEFIMATPEGYQTNIGDRGMKLSGGQRQRLTIARALLRNPEILILDEATSALDSESEKLVQAALNQLLRDRTAIVIAHRLSTIQYADRIAVLKEGRIIETGTHEALIQAGGEYHKLVMLQAL